MRAFETGGRGVRAVARGCFKFRPPLSAVALLPPAIRAKFWEKGLEIRFILSILGTLRPFGHFESAFRVDSGCAGRFWAFWGDVTSSGPPSTPGRARGRLWGVLAGVGRCSGHLRGSDHEGTANRRGWGHLCVVGVGLCVRSWSQNSKSILMSLTWCFFLSRSTSTNCVYVCIV